MLQKSTESLKPGGERIYSNVNARIKYFDDQNTLGTKMNRCGPGSQKTVL